MFGCGHEFFQGSTASLKSSLRKMLAFGERFFYNYEAGKRFAVHPMTSIPGIDSAAWTPGL
jgi:hypothetical protein